jgi:hypothetical protein
MTDLKDLSVDELFALAGASSAPTVTTSQRPGWGQSAYQVGKSYLGGAAGLLDLAGSGIQGLGDAFRGSQVWALRQLGYGNPSITFQPSLPAPSIRQELEGASQKIAPNIFGYAADERGDVVTGSAADIVKGAVEGLAFPALGLKRVGAQVAGNVASGGLAELGRQAGGDVGGIIGGLSPAIFSMGRAPLARFFGPKTRAGTNLLREAGPDGAARIKQMAPDAVPPHTTYAEIADTPSAARFQGVVEKTSGSPTARNTMARAEDARSAAIRSTFEDASQAGMAKSGSEIRGDILDVAKQQIDQANAMYKQIGDVPGIDVSHLRQLAKKEMKEKFGRSGFGADPVAQVPYKQLMRGGSERAKKIETVENLFSQFDTPSTGTAKDAMRAAGIGKKSSTMTLQQLEGVRQDAGTALAKLPPGKGFQKERQVLGRLTQAIDETFDGVAVQRGSDFIAGTQKARAVNTLKAARVARAQAATTFENDWILNLKRRSPSGKEYHVVDSDVLNTITRKPESIRAVIEASGNDPGTIAGIKRHIIEKKVIPSGDLGSAISQPGKTWMTNWKENRQLAEAVFSPEEMQLLDAAMANLASKAKILANANRASRGQSITGEILAATSDFIGTFWPAKAANALTRNFTEQWLARGMTDPETLRMLADTSAQTSIPALAQKMARSLAITGNVLASDRDAYYEARQDTRDMSEFDISDILDDGYWSDMGVSEKKNLTSPEVTAMMKPHQFDPVIEQAANSAGIPAPLLKSLVIQESNYRPDAKSNKGALGLTQIMPSTARDIARKLGRETYDLKDPATALEFGAFYLAEKINAFNGDIPLALTAYHTGEGRVKQLLRQRKGSSLEDIIDGLGPIGKQYAKAVLGRTGDV